MTFSGENSEQELQEFISKINKFHDTIKFTFNYSNKEATFLDVNSLVHFGLLSGHLLGNSYPLS